MKLLLLFWLNIKYMYSLLFVTFHDKATARIFYFLSRPPYCKAFLIFCICIKCQNMAHFLHLHKTLLPVNSGFLFIMLISSFTHFISTISEEIQHSGTLVFFVRNQIPYFSIANFAEFWIFQLHLLKLTTHRQIVGLLKIRKDYIYESNGNRKTNRWMRYNNTKAGKTA